MMYFGLKIGDIPAIAMLVYQTHRIHGTAIFTNIYHKHQPNVGKYTRVSMEVIVTS